MKHIHLKMLVGVFCLSMLLLTNCSQPNSKSTLLYESGNYKIFSDKVIQGKYEAKAISSTSIQSNYQSPSNATYNSYLEFKFSINGKDNELAFGVNHQLLMERDADGKVKAPLIEFGKQLRNTKSIPENSFLKPNTELTLRVDFNPVLKSFKEKGFYEDVHNQKLFESDFKGLFIAGGSEPLSWDFENLPSRSNMELKDVDGDGIFEIKLIMNAYNEDNFTAQEWKLKEDISAFPTYKSDQLLIDALYNMSLEEQLLDIRKDGAYMAGAKWEGVWTRDISYSILLSLAIINPEVCMKSLMHKVKNDRIIQDTGTGGAWPVSTDRMTWALAAWEIYVVTGDNEWLRKAYKIIKNSAEDDLKTVFHPETGLVLGESSFLDWRKQTYPLWMQPVDIYNSQCLGTNAVHFKTYNILAQMANILGEDSKNYDDTANQIKKGINKYLWDENKGYYGQYLYGRNALYLSDRSEALGEALAVLFDIPDSDNLVRLVENTPVMEYGIPSIYPQIPGIPPYHNNGIWPFVQSYWNWAAAKAGNEKALSQGLAALYRQAALFLTNKENMVANTGDFKGTEINSDRQLWSVAGDLAMVYRVFFGMEFKYDGLYFKPFVPQKIKGKKLLENFKYRKAVLDITLEGTGNIVESFKIDGNEKEQFNIPGDLTGKHSITIKLKNSSTNSTINITEHKETLGTPVLKQRAKGVRWEKIEGAQKYNVYNNGELVSTTSKNFYEYANTNKFYEFTVAAIDNEEVSSFLSEPLIFVPNQRISIYEAEQSQLKSKKKLKGYSGSGFIELTKTQNNNMNFNVRVKKDGTYLLSFRYSNGSGPVNTNNMCAIRSLTVDNKMVGAIVMPQRGFDEWSNWGYSNSVKLDLKKGNHTIGLSFKPHNENMNYEVNTAMLDHLQLIYID